MARSCTPGYRAGYGKPPTHTRFKPGQSGNPGGRGKGKSKAKPPPPANLSAEHAQTLHLLSEEVTWEEGGRVRHMTVSEAAQRALIGQALAGDVRAIKMVQEQEARVHAALDAIRAAERLADSTALTLKIAARIRSEGLAKLDTPRPGSGDGADAAPPVDGLPEPCRREEDSPLPRAGLADDLLEWEGYPCAPTLDGKEAACATERPSAYGREVAPGASMDATGAAPSISHRQERVWGQEQPCVPPIVTRRRRRRRRPTNEPKIRNPRPLIAPFR